MAQKKLNHKKKILLVISPWENRWSLGNEAGVSDDIYFIRGFTRAGFELHFLVPEGTEDSDSSFDDVFFHTYPNFFRRTSSYPVLLKRVLWPWLFNRTVTPLARSLVHSTRPDFVLGHSHYTTRIAHLCRTEAGVPCGVKLFGVMDLVHTEWPRLKYLWKNFEQLAALRYPQDVWIVLDDGTKGDRILEGRGVPAEKISFLPNGINLEWQENVYDRTGIRAEFGIENETTVVLFLARLVAYKRPRELIGSIPGVLKRTSRKILFVFAGDGLQRSECEALARQLGVSGSTRFLGTVRHADVPRVMSAADIFVTTSSLTNMAIPTCEALVCGLPVIAYNIGDTGKVVQPDKTGILVEDKNQESLAGAIALLADDEEKRRRLGENARRFARETFTGWDERIRMELEIINRLIG